MAKRHEDWQVKQADTALRLYDYFLSETISPTTGKPSSNQEIWRFLEERMGDAPRLRSSKNWIPAFAGMTLFYENLNL